MDAATRTHIRFRRSEIRRAALERTGGKPPLLTHDEWMKEIETAIVSFERAERKRNAWPPVCKVPMAAQHAVATP